MVSAIDRKLLRDLAQLRGQVLTICLVVAAGIAAYLAMQTAYRSLAESKDAYYEDYRFPDVFAQAKRVPAGVESRLRAIPGVEIAYTRTVERVRLPLPSRDQPFSGRIVSLPDRGTPPLGDVHVERGRMPEEAGVDEALLLESFAKANLIAPGDRLPVVIEGRLRQVVVTGLAMSPEYVFALDGDVFSYEPGAFAVLWMRNAFVAPAFDMAGAFNDVVLRLEPGASEPGVVAEVDRILAPYGGFGAFARDRHVSHHFISGELEQLAIQATFIPLIFLGVAAFLVNVVLGRLIQIQRTQIATLKAIGYSDTAVGLHYLKLVSAIVLLGAAVGIGFGAWLGGGLTGLYEPYFRFPVFEHRFDLDVVLTALGISLGSAVAGALLSVRRIVALHPAEAMRPAAPAVYRTTAFDHLSRPFFGALGRMVVRELARRPLRVFVSALGISFAVAILIIGRFAFDSLGDLLDLQFRRSMREDLTVSFRDPLPERATRALRQLPGVLHSEGIRAVPVRLRSGAARRDSVILGLPGEGRLRRLLDREGREVALPVAGLLLTDILAERLGATPGDLLEIEVLEGDRRRRLVPFAGTVRDLLGMQGYMLRDALHRLLDEPPTVSTVLLAVDPAGVAETQSRLNLLPAVASTSSPRASMERFQRQQGGMMETMNTVLAFFASVIAVGIVYNNARVSLSMRSRDLASMRVLGFTRAEVSTVLLGELAVQVALALPIGMWLGTIATEALLSLDPENFRMPAALSGRTYVYAALVTMAAALASALLVRRRLDRLDLIGVLKTSE